MSENKPMPYEGNIAHHIPGRMRLKLPGAKGKHRLLQQIKESISQLPGVTQVHTNSTTGSLVIHYDSHEPKDFENYLTNHANGDRLFTVNPPIITELDEIEAKIEAEAEFLAERSETARSIINLIKRANEQVKQATDNMVDLNVLLPLAIGLYAFFWVDREKGAPLWVTLMIFSFNSFLNLNKPKRALNTQQQKLISGKHRQEADE